MTSQLSIGLLAEQRPRLGVRRGRLLFTEARRAVPCGAVPYLAAPHVRRTLHDDDDHIFKVDVDLLGRQWLYLPGRG